MSLSNLKITFHLDGTGLYYDPYEPIHLDALMAWALMPFHRQKGDEAPTRNSEPIDVPLPLGKWHINGHWGWCASALFPEGEIGESLQFWRKKFRQNKIELTRGSPNLQNGIYREYNHPLPLLLTKKMIAYAVGDRGRVHQILKKHIRYLGKKAAYGRGRVLSVDVNIIDNDYSLTKDGKTMRYLPYDRGIRLVRIRPPYWSNYDRILCAEIGSEINKLKNKKN